jgi:HK97 family phage major capsid protein
MFEKTESKFDLIAKRNALTAQIAEEKLHANANGQLPVMTQGRVQILEDQLDEANAALEDYNQRHSLRPIRPGKNENGGGNGNAPDQRFKFPGVGEFIRSGEGGVKAALSEGGDLQFVVPGYEVLPFKDAYPTIDPFRTAGASITQLDTGWVDGKQPIITGGADPSIYAEGAGPTSDESVHVYVASLDSPDKVAFLTKPTEEAFEDVSALGDALTREGVKRISNKETKLITAALVSSLTSASALVVSEHDNYTDILNLISAIPTFFAGPQNVFMGSRRTRALLQNTRAGADNLPVFDPTLATLLSYRFIINDYLPAGELLFGDFANAVYTRRAALHVQVITEAYREAGKIGVRFYQRSARAFFSDAASAAQSEQPVYLLMSDFGS